MLWMAGFMNLTKSSDFLRPLQVFYPVYYGHYHGLISQGA